MLSDFHVHTTYSADADAEPELQVRQAISLGMKELCITDHYDYDSSQPDYVLVADLSRYQPHLERLQNQYRDQIRLNIGIELGLQLREQEALAQTAAGYPYDYIIGSSHLVDGQDPWYREMFHGRSERDAYERYFEVTLQRVRRMDCFDAFGHLDYIVRYGPNTNQYYSYDAYREWIDPILTTLIAGGKALECNTGGLKYGLGHPNPAEDVLRRYRELGGELLTVGSDAHQVQHLGYSFRQLPELLKSCGFRYYTIYHQRTPEMIPLE